MKQRFASINMTSEELFSREVLLMNYSGRLHETYNFLYILDALQKEKLNKLQL